MAKRKMTKREREAYTRRAKIMSSKAFQDWWRFRRHIMPIPSDPYRAFMIDRGLHAQHVDKPIWKFRTNRTDNPPIDNARGVRPSKGRRQRPKRRYRRDFVPVTVRKPQVLTAEETELKTLVVKMAERYHVPEPDIVFERRQGQMTSAMIHGGFGVVKPFIKIGVKGLRKKTIPAHKSVIAHEMGHHVHRRGQVGVMSAVGVKEYFESRKVEKEKAAWKIADPFMTDQRAVQKWLKTYALGTYTGRTPRRR